MAWQSTDFLLPNEVKIHLHSYVNVFLHWLDMFISVLSLRIQL